MLLSHNEIIREETKVSLRDTYDHVMQSLDLIDSYNEITTGLTDIYLSSISNRMNQIMKIHKRNLDSYQCEVYNKLEFYLTRISEKFKNSRVIKPFAFIFEKMDSSESNEKPFLPIFITENLSDYYFKNNPRKSQEIITASKISGVQNATKSLSSLAICIKT